MTYDSMNRNLQNHSENMTIEKAINCEIEQNRTESLYGESNDYCRVFYDSLLCWPRTPINTRAIIPCFKVYNNVWYDTSKNASRLCLYNGTWDLMADYSRCKPLKIPEEDIFQNLSSVRETSKIFFFGYGISLVALLVALFIFLYFQELKCMRNRIHTNLIITYILIDILWIINFQNLFAEQFHCLLFVFLNYFLTTSYFWMFVEGLYLYLLVMQTFSVDKLPLYFYNVLGWGLSATFMIIWAPFKYMYGHREDNNMVQCRWIERDQWDYIYIAPILIVLLLNIFFMCVIIYVLITKLRVSNSAESQQYRKATKAMLVLIPLLGANYWFFLLTPQEETARLIILNLRAFLYSTQGLFVAILYCFMNGEVKNCIKNHLERYKSLRSLYSQKHPRHNVNVANKGSGSSASTLLNPTIGENDTLDSNDIHTSLLKRGQQLKDFNNTTEFRHNLLQVNLFNPHNSLCNPE